MVKITIKDITDPTPANGWIVGYRKKGTAGAYITPVGSPFTTTPIVFSTGDPAGTLYEGFIKADCGGGVVSAAYNWTTPCGCTGAGYNPAPSGEECRKVTSVAPTVSAVGYCLVAAKDTLYNTLGARIYNPGFTLASLNVPFGTPDVRIFGTMTHNPYWANTAETLAAGNLNREGIWADSDCDGTADDLGGEVEYTIGAVYTNPGEEKTIHIGISGRAQFRVILNGTTVIDTGTSSGDFQYKIWHIFPVTVVKGVNYFNFTGKKNPYGPSGFGAIIYDNTAIQLLLATSDAELNILFRSGTLRGTTFDVALCGAGFTLETSGGSGNYACVKTEYKPCNTLS